MEQKKLLIVGGVAGGASCAARARRLSEAAKIIVFEKGPYVSFANCGLPYYVGQLIEKEEDLLIATPAFFKKRFNIDIRVHHHVRKIDREKKEIEIENLKNGKVYRESYDTLVLSPGSVPVKPNIEGIDIPGVFTLWTIPDMRKIIDWTKEKKIHRAVVIGGGFLGLEMTENLERMGIHVSIVEMQHHVMPNLDPEMASFLHDHLQEKKVKLYLNSAVSKLETTDDNCIAISLSSGICISADMVILAVGAKPRIELAKEAGLSIGSLGGIAVDEYMRTTDPDILAVGDAVEVKNVVDQGQIRAPLAGPANRQGRIAADVIFGSKINPQKFRGSQVTTVCGIMGMTIASTGLTEKWIESKGDASDVEPYEKIYLHPYHHAGYYPGAKTISIKLLFSKKDGRILGAQAVGLEGVEKRIDVIAMAIQKNASVFDLEEAELCYAPQYGSAKDPVNLAGMIAANVLRGYTSVVHWEDIDTEKDFILDVRDKDEFQESHVDNAIHIPLNELRRHMSELPIDREIYIHCLVGLRSYTAERILAQNGFKARNISGGYLTYQAVSGIKKMDTMNS